jgi:hypothetical protein
MPSGEAPGPQSPSSLGSNYITTYGMLGYLQTETVIHLSPATDVPVATVTESTSYHWHWLRLSATIILTGLAIGATFFVYRYQMTVGVVPGYCAGCAYPLAECGSGRCPECGEVSSSPTGSTSA